MLDEKEGNDAYCWDATPGSPLDLEVETTLVGRREIVEEKSSPSRLAERLKKRFDPATRRRGSSSLEPAVALRLWVHRVGYGIKGRGCKRKMRESFAPYISGVPSPIEA